MCWYRFKELAVVWFQYGTGNIQGPAKRRLVITNVLITLVSFNTLVYATAFALYDFDALWIPISILVPLALLILLTPLLHRFGVYAGSIYNLILWMCLASAFSYVFGAGSGLHFYFLSGSTVAILIMGIRYNFLSIVSILAGVFCFMYADRNFTAPAPFIDVPETLIAALNYTSVPWSFLIIFCIIHYAFYEANKAEKLLANQHAFSERLLENMLPTSIAEQLKTNPDTTIADDHPAVTILFADIVNFSERAQHGTAQNLVEYLNRLFTQFDALAHRHGVEKIKTIGDAFMAAGGLPQARSDHAQRVANMAIDMIKTAHQISKEFGEGIELRVGIHSGAAVAGVIGSQKPVYDVWGDTVNIAARMEKYGAVGKVHVSAVTKRLLENDFVFGSSEPTKIKGLGEMETWYIEGKK